MWRAQGRHLRIIGGSGNRVTVPITGRGTVKGDIRALQTVIQLRGYAYLAGGLRLQVVGSARTERSDGARPTERCWTAAQREHRPSVPCMGTAHRRHGGTEVQQLDPEIAGQMPAEQVRAGRLGHASVWSQARMRSAANSRRCCSEPTKWLSRNRRRLRAGATPAGAQVSTALVRVQTAPRFIGCQSPERRQDRLTLRAWLVRSHSHSASNFPSGAVKSGCDQLTHWQERFGRLRRDMRQQKRTLIIVLLHQFHLGFTLPLVQHAVIEYA
jgi:hypothetical protein